MVLPRMNTYYAWLVIGAIRTFPRVNLRSIFDCLPIEKKKYAQYKLSLYKKLRSLRSYTHPFVTGNLTVDIGSRT